MKRIFTITMLLLLASYTLAQFPPAAGQEGSTAVYADSVAFIEWASSCTIERGWVNIADQDAGKASHGNTQNAVGKADNAVVSLGDGGMATLFFETPLIDGIGWDFAVFENSFSDYFLELAFVEISSDATHFFRLPAISLTQTAVQISAFDSIHPEKVHKLAGKYRALYGVPFDINNIPDTTLLKKDSIVAIRIIDVVGSIDTAFATFDSEGNIINEPWPTPFASSGFDLDAIGVRYNRGSLSIAANQPLPTLHVFPNPCSRFLSYQIDHEAEKIEIIDNNGNVMKTIVSPSRKGKISMESFPVGMYFIKAQSKESSCILPFIHQ